MKFYLAGDYELRETLAELADQLEQVGHEITSRWVRESVADPLTPADSRRIALADLDDLSAAEAMVLVNGPSTRGGKHAELGAALAMDMPVFLIGPRSNIFHHHLLVTQVWPTADVAGIMVLRAEVGCGEEGEVIG